MAGMDPGDGAVHACDEVGVDPVRPGPAAVAQDGRVAEHVPAAQGTRAFAGPGPGIWKGADRRAAHVRSGSMRRGPRVSSQSAGASHAVWSIAGDKEDETRKIEEAISFSSCDSEGGSNGARGDARFSALYGPAAENAQAGGPPLLGLVVRAQQRQVHLCTTHWYHIKSTSMS
jgi:hypothetical protein